MNIFETLADLNTPAHINKLLRDKFEYNVHRSEKLSDDVQGVLFFTNREESLQESTVEECRSEVPESLQSTKNEGVELHKITPVMHNLAFVFRKYEGE